MAKYLVETYYNCSFKVSHYLDSIDENELSNLEKREDGKFEILDVKLDNRKTKSLDKNSKNITIENKDSKKIDIISLAPMISEDLKRIANSTSVSSLFK